MAERRMFSKQIIDSDFFLDLPLSAQALYFHLSMRADDEGFVNSPKRIQRLIGASEDDFRLLELKRYILTFDSGVIVIKHWKIHNYIQKDRFKETLCVEEKSTLALDEKNAYIEAEKVPCIQDVSNMDTQYSIVKNSIVKNSIVKEPQKRFTPPTLEEVKAYCQERNNSVDAERFINYYTSNGWQVGKTKMKDWKAAVRTWERSGYNNEQKPNNKANDKAMENCNKLLKQFEKKKQNGIA
ncbi:MAG: hypothetical protein J6S67_25645 [Methanobrevibacter sp.]|nr:hypothetical protein [Methanobrevibacter sp.]